MDLGYGQNNQHVGQVAANAIQQAAAVQAQLIDDEMAAYDALLEDDKALEMLRSKRLEQMKKEQQDKSKWRSNGHGVYSELAQGQDTRDVARDFFEASKNSERLVVHFYRPTTPSCDIFHAHLEKLAAKHMETRFVKINVEGADNERGGGGSAFLVDKLGIRVMPTLVICKNRKVEHQLRGFDELGATEDFSTELLAHVLAYHGALFATDDEQNPPEMEESFARRRGRGVNSVNISSGQRKNNQSSVDGEDFY